MDAARWLLLHSAGCSTVAAALRSSLAASSTTGNWATCSIAASASAAVVAVAAVAAVVAAAVVADGDDADDGAGDDYAAWAVLALFDAMISVLRRLFGLQSIKHSVIIIIATSSLS